MNSLQALADSPLTERLGWILLHSIWQALAVAIGLALVLPTARRRSAQAGYAVCCGALLLTILLPALTFPFVPKTEGHRRELQNVTVPPLAVSAVTISNGGIPESSAGMPRTPRPTGAVERPWFKRALPGTGDRPSSPTAAGSPLAAAVEPAAIELSLKERAVSLLRQIQAQLSWSLPWIVLVWSFGVAALSLWNVGGWFAVQRLKTRATFPVTDTIQDAAARIAEQLGLLRTVRLLQSALVETPVVIGALKPVILLPASLVTELPLDQLESLLAHELAHVLRQDYLVNLLQSVIETLLFYHPAVWWISSQVRAERENCCDDMAVGLAADRTIYVQALAAAAGARAPRIAPAATGGLLLPRLRRILGMTDPHSAHPSRWLTGAVMLSLCATVFALLAFDSRSATAQTKLPQTETVKKSPSKTPESAKPQPPKAKPVIQVTRPQTSTKGSMQIKVVDTAGQPLPNARIHVSIWTQENFPHNRDYTCDAQGIVTVDLPKTLEILRLWGSKAGYCGGFHNFQTNAQVQELSIPDDFTFRLIKGTIIGGVVKNERGEPVKGARVGYTYEGGFFDSDKGASTDAQGRWKCDDVYPDEEIRIRVTHPDYISDQRGGELQDKQKVTTQALRAQTATIVMQHGIRVAGKVTDPEGKPVKDAVAIWGDNPYLQLGSQEVLTDAAGQYRFPVFAPGSMRVTVVAKGWRPETRKIEITPQIQSTDFQLKPGKKLRIRFVDRSGNPVPGVGIMIDKWRGAQALYNHDHPNVVDVKIPRKANQDGIFAWDWAPDDAVSYRCFAPGFAAANATIAADDREHVQTMKRVLQITGTVRDAATGRSIDDFLVVPVIHFRPDFPSLDRMNAKKQKRGRFAMEFDRADIEHGVQIEVPGYRTFRTTDRYRVDEAPPVLDIRLQPAERSIGRVLNPEGRPVKGARVSLASRLEQLDPDGLNERGPNVYTSNYQFNTDDRGGFEIASQLDRYALVVVAPEGFAEVEHQPDQTPGEIRLQRWASLTGQLVQSGEPVPNCEIFLNPIRIMGSDNPHNLSRLTAKTGEDGSFAFERVPPVACRVEAFLHFSAKSPLTSSSSVPLRLKPGEKAHVILGGPGIDVTGQLVAENQPRGFDYHFAINFLVAKRPGIEPPASLAGKGFDWQKGWSDSWRNSSEGQAYLNTLHHWFVKPEPDGRFRVSGLEPGEYDFAVNLYGTTEGCLVHPIASRVVHFSVKPGEQQLDLGKVSIPSMTLPKVGDLAADFEFTTLDGTKTSLAAMRGKYVLLDFWATWCGSCVAKLDEVEHLCKQFEADDRLVVVGVNLDSETEHAREFLKTKPLAWQHALLGDWSSTDVPRRFAISTVPAYVLIDPSGRILAHESSLEEIASKLNRLSKEQPERDKHRS